MDTTSKISSDNKPASIYDERQSSGFLESKGSFDGGAENSSIEGDEFEYQYELESPNYVNTPEISSECFTVGGAGTHDHELHMFQSTSSRCNVLEREQLKKEMEKLVAETSDLLNLSQAKAEVILRCYKWRMEKITERYYCSSEDTQPLLEKFQSLKMGNFSSIRQNPVLQPDICCGVCYESQKNDKLFSLVCMHSFCRECWTQYLTTHVENGPNCLFTVCMEQKCIQIVTRDVFKKFLKSDMFLQYEKYALDSYVTLSPYYCWCPGGCERAICASSKSCGHSKCTCGFSFCFSCMEEVHAPASCDSLKAWKEECENKRELLSRVLYRTVQCPTCHARLEKKEFKQQKVCIPEKGEPLIVVVAGESKEVALPPHKKPGDMFLLPPEKPQCWNKMICNCKYTFCSVCMKCWSSEEHNKSSAEHDECDKSWKPDQITGNDKECDSVLDWILPNTKNCPNLKCKTIIEKNLGCNHMKCLACGKEFCWVCLKPWEEHKGSFYDCHIFENRTIQHKNTSQYESTNSNTEQCTAVIIPAEDERFIHFFERYYNHHQAQKVAEQQARCAGSGRVQPSQHYYKQLVEYRKALKFTYVFDYYQVEAHELFAHQMGDLERLTEYLSDICELPPEKWNAQNAEDCNSATSKFLRAVLKVAKDGLYTPLGGIDSVLKKSLEKKQHTEPLKTQWKCSLCTSDSHDSSEKCSMCKISRYADFPREQWTCMCKLDNEPSAVNCAACHSSKHTVPAPNTEVFDGTKDTPDSVTFGCMLV